MIVCDLGEMGRKSVQASYCTYVHTHVLSVQMQHVHYISADRECSCCRKYTQASPETTTASLHLSQSPRSTGKRSFRSAPPSSCTLLSLSLSVF